MVWQVRFIPDEVASMTNSCNGNHPIDWSTIKEDCTKGIPDQWGYNTGCPFCC